MSLKPVGSLYLIEKYGLSHHFPLQTKSWIAPRGFEREVGRFGTKERHFTAQYEPEDSLGGHLEFILKYEGTDLPLLLEILKAASRDELINYIQSKQTGKYARRIWYIAERIGDLDLSAIPDLKMGNYVPLLEPTEYLTSPGPKSNRHRIEENLLGTLDLSPLIRRTKRLNDFLTVDYAEKARAVIEPYPPELLARAMHYLYTKETKSSFEIEKEIPSAKKAERFVQVLRNVGRKDYLQKKNLIDLQNEIVDPRFADTDYRKNQSYVGETLTSFRQRVHYICPQPKDLESLMEGLRLIAEKGLLGNQHAFALATMVSFLFVFIHPFEDGNGRIHRFLLHDLLSKTGFTPPEIMLPISATLLRNKARYDQMLESFSEGLVPLIDFDLDENGRMTVRGETRELYRFIDLTAILEGMFAILDETIEKDLADELKYLASFDINMETLKEIVDMPDKDLNLFVRLCLSNGGKLSATKRKSHFAALTDAEVAALEQALVKTQV